MDFSNNSFLALSGNNFRFEEETLMGADSSKRISTRILLHSSVLVPDLPQTTAAEVGSRGRWTTGTSIIEPSIKRLMIFGRKTRNLSTVEFFSEGTNLMGVK